MVLFKFETSLAHVVRPWLKNKNKQKMFGFEVSGIGTQVIRFVGKNLYTLSHFTGLRMGRFDMKLFPGRVPPLPTHTHTAKTPLSSQGLQIKCYTLAAMFAASKGFRWWSVYFLKQGFTKHPQLALNLSSSDRWQTTVLLNAGITGMDDHTPQVLSFKGQDAGSV